MSAQSPLACCRSALIISVTDVVYADADIEKVIAGSANAIFFDQGECCVAGSRLHVEESAYDRVVEGIAAQARNIKSATGWTSRP